MLVSSVGVAVGVGVGLGFQRVEGNSMAMGGEEGCIKGRLQGGVSNVRDEGGEASFYTPGGVPWHGRTQTQGARSLLPWNILSNGPSTDGRMEFLCASKFSQSRNVPRFLGDQGVEMGSSFHRRGFCDRAIREKHGTCHECSRTVGVGVCT